MGGQYVMGCNHVRGPGRRGPGPMPLPQGLRGPGESDTGPGSETDQRTEAWRLQARGKARQELRRVGKT